MQFSRGSIGTYMGVGGVIITARVGEPRFEYDPVTGDNLGLLIESSTTNTAASSNFEFWPVFKGALPSEDGATKTFETGLVGAFESSYLFTTVDRTITDVHISNPNGTALLQTNDIASVFCKLKTAVGTPPTIFLRNQTAPSSAHLDLNTLTAVASGTQWTDAGFMDCGNGWYRLYARYIGTATTAARVQVGLNGTIGSIPLNGTAIYINGIQFEAGTSTLTSYILNNSFSTYTTRAADTLTLPTSGLITSSGGIILTESSISRDAAAAAPNRRVFSINNFSSSNETQLIIPREDSGGARLVIRSP
jgi:hypothetical protein